MCKLIKLALPQSNLMESWDGNISHSPVIIPLLIFLQNKGRRLIGIEHGKLNSKNNRTSLADANCTLWQMQIFDKQQVPRSISGSGILAFYNSFLFAFDLVCWEAPVSCKSYHPINKDIPPNVQPFQCDVVQEHQWSHYIRLSRQYNYIYWLFSAVSPA